MAENVEVAIQQALLRRAQAFATAQGLTIAMPNMDFDKPVVSQTAKWLRATLLPNETIPLALTYTGKNQHFGLLQIDVFYGLGAGEMAPGRIAAACIDYFTRGTTVSSDGFVAQIWRQPFRGPIITDESWSMIPVRVPYVCLAAP